MENTKICKKCQIEKDFSNFGQCKGGKNGLRAICKICLNEIYRNYRLNHLEQYAKWSRKYREEEKEKYNNYDRNYRKEYTNTLKGYTTRLVSAAKERSKRKGLDFTITREFILNKLFNLKCEATGFDLTIKKSSNSRVNPLKPTLDRIDNSKGYTLENTRVTCWWWNVMKQDWTDKEIINLIKNYKENDR